ncbi:MAG: LysE family transporter [Candidatus Hydrothermarchaeota archaeon]|nr:LysE family transporter [Candidatus Hydrothermarchaeota archaeon]
MLDSIGQFLPLPWLLFLTIIISLSGVLMPGPVFAVTVAKGHQNKYAGAFIAMGHGLVELPLITLIYLGFVQFITGAGFRRGIAFFGGAALLYLGYGLYMARNRVLEERREVSYGAFSAGVITTVANPYFFIWWATIGASLIMSASFYGFIGFLLFAFVHWMCDFLWNLGVSWTVFKSKKFWNPRVHEIVFGGCGLLLAIFGGWFIYYSFA